ncbi:MAG: PilZ domain-containing protein [Myxococcales bacterium]|nr:PilZ domain-containing protein [Myxococcales bacterium]
MGSDKRAFPRYELTAYVEYTSKGEKRTHKVQNISLGGLCIHTAFFQRPGTEVDLVVNFPELGDARVEARGEVVWLNEALEDMGVRFVELDQPAREVLSRYIEQAAAAHPSS